MTTPTNPSEKLKKIREEHEKSLAELIEATRLEDEARIAKEEAETTAALEAFELKEAEAEKAFNEAQAKKKALQAATEQHKTLFGKSPKIAATSTESGILAKIRFGLSKFWDWLKSWGPFAIKLVVLIALAWGLVWMYFGIANFLGDKANVGYVDTGAVSDPESVIVPTITLEPTITAITEPTSEPTLEPTAEPTAVAKAPAPTKKPKPAAEKPRPTAVVAPAIPISWDSGPAGTYKPTAGMICHGDQVGPYGSKDGLHPVIVQFWSNQPEPLSFVWASCEVNTGRNLNQIKTEIESKYGKTFEVVNN